MTGGALLGARRDATDLRRERSPGAALLYALAATAILSAAFALRQNTSPVTGGPISIPKILWLNYAVMAWFVTPAFLARDRRVPATLRRIFGIHLLSMVARGLVELWMLYVTLGWSPLYGIAHDSFQIGLIASLRLGSREHGSSPFAGSDRRFRGFLTAIQCGLVAEIVFAWLFFETGVHRQAIYFASTDPAYDFINGLTLCVVVVAYAHLVSFLWKQRSIPLPRREAS